MIIVVAMAFSALVETVAAPCNKIGRQLNPT